jgi:hypothetical protein
MDDKRSWRDDHMRFSLFPVPQASAGQLSSALTVSVAYYTVRESRPTMGSLLHVVDHGQQFLMIKVIFNIYTVDSVL